MEHFNPASQAATESAPDWERIAPVLDEAMAELDDAEHEAVLLRYFKSHDFHAVGLALGVSDDAAQKRVSRAVERPRYRWRGVTTGASGLTSSSRPTPSKPRPWDWLSRLQAPLSLPEQRSPPP
jgi:hypothetical protein